MAFLAFISISLVAFAMTPQSLCEKPDHFDQWAPSLQEEFNEVCRHAGQYEESLLPDSQVTSAGKFRAGEAVIYDYKDFAKSLSESVGGLDRKEICNPKIGRVAYPSILLEDTATGTIPVSVLSEEELNQIYQEMSEDPTYAFDVPEEGCWARALMMTRALEKKGIRAVKIFFEGPLWVPMKEDNEITLGKKWAYHVAPMVAVKTAKGIEMRGIDPTIFDKPVTAKKWGDTLFSFSEEKGTAKLYITDRFVTEPLLDKPVEALMSPSTRGHWHKAETILAEQELKRLRQEGDDRAAMKDLFGDESFETRPEE